MTQFGTSRRIVLGGAVSGLLTRGLARDAAAQPALPLQPGRPVISVLARDLRNGWGVCGRPGLDAGIDAYAAMLEQIGTRDIRTSLVVNGSSALPRFEELRRRMRQARMAAPTPRVTALVSAYLNDPRTTWRGQQPALLAMAATGMLRGIEGPNEINNREVGDGSHGPDDLTDQTGLLAFPGNFRAWAQALHQFRQANAAALRGISLVAPSIASGLPWEYARLPDVRAFVDAGNVHFYAGGGRQPSYSTGINPMVGYFANVAGWARSAQVQDGPFWLTESGATTSGNYARDGVSQAKYIANQFFDLFASGGSRLFFYQLIDGDGAPGNIEGNFGLFRHNGTPKPAAIMLGNLKHLLSLDTYDNPRNTADLEAVTPAYDASALAVSGMGDVGQAGPGYLVMHKSDGSTMIAVWNEPAIDDGKGNSLAPAPRTVTLDFGSVQTFSIHDLLGATPLTGTTPRGTQFDTGRTTTVALRGYPMLVELRPSAGKG